MKVEYFVKDKCNRNGLVLHLEDFRRVVEITDEAYRKGKIEILEALEKPMQEMRISLITISKSWVSELVPAFLFRSSIR